MKPSHLAIVSGIVLVIILTVSWCGRKPKVEYTGLPLPTPTPASVGSAAAAPSATAQPATAQTSPAASNQTPSPVLLKVAERISPAVILISVFDEPGKLLRTGTGFFISQGGRFVTNWHVIADGAHAVAKTNDGRIYNVTGALSEIEAADLAVLQAEIKKPVSFLTSGRATQPQPGTRVAAIASPLARGVPRVFAATVSATKSDENGEQIGLTPAPPNEMMGAPVVNENGELLGVLAQSAQPGGTNIVRSASGIDLLLAKIDKDAKARWRGAHAHGSPSPSTPTEEEGKEEAAATPQPTVQPATRTIPTTTLRTDKPKIISNPKPSYPAYSYFHEQGSGRFRITFSAKGNVKNVEVIESTKSTTLDSVTVEALRRWKATPGQEWNVTVPVTFERR
jgi:TonB family protein